MVLRSEDREERGSVNTTSVKISSVTEMLRYRHSGLWNGNRAIAILD